MCRSRIQKGHGGDSSCLFRGPQLGRHGRLRLEGHCQAGFLTHLSGSWAGTAAGQARLGLSSGRPTCGLSSRVFSGETEFLPGHPRLRWPGPQCIKQVLRGLSLEVSREAFSRTGLVINLPRFKTLCLSRERVAEKLQWYFFQTATMVFWAGRIGRKRGSHES